MSMYSKTTELKKSSFNFIMHMLNTALWRRQPQTLNGYFLVNNGNKFQFSTATLMFVMAYDQILNLNQINN